MAYGRRNVLQTTNRSPFIIFIDDDIDDDDQICIKSGNDETEISL